MRSRSFRKRVGRCTQVVFFERLEERQLLATYTVTNTMDSGPGSLRQAIMDSNNNKTGAPNLIDFNIPGSGVQTIAPASQLPTITTPVTIDGYSQPGAHPNTNGPREGDNATLLIQLSGTNVPYQTTGPTGVLPAGFLITAGNSTIQGLVISNFVGHGSGNGIDLQSNGNTVAGNFIGTTPDGSAASSIYNDVGVLLEGSSNVIGGTSPADRNVISGNSYGVQQPPLAVNLPTGNLVEGNLIGLDATGTKSMGQGTGIDIESGSGMTIGGTATGAGNVITGNTMVGINIILEGPSGLVQSSNGGELIEGNLIGTDVTGTALVKLFNPSTGSTGNLTGNGAGIRLLEESYQPAQNPIVSTIGGTAAGAGNVISGNYGDGISLGTLVIGTLVQGNLIGVDVTGTGPLGNPNGGVDCESGPNTIGGTVAGAGNTIAFNGIGQISTNGGVVIGSSAAKGTSILENSIFGNSPGIGIASSLTPAVPAPILTSVATTSGGQTLIQGTVQSTPSSSVRVEFFANAMADPTGNGQGQTFLGSAQVMTDASGNGTFSATVAAFPASETIIAATATDSNNDTSDFSKDYQPQANVSPTVTTLTVLPGTTITVGQTVTVQAVVTAPGETTPTGPVVFSVDGIAQPAVQLSALSGLVGGQLAGQATISLPGLTVGTHQVSASFQGSSGFSPSSAGSIQIVVNSIAAVTTTTRLILPSGPITSGSPISMQAIVSASGQTVPGGTVTISVDGVVVKTATLSPANNQQQATISIPGLSPGTHQLIATYSGAPGFSRSTVGPIQVVVSSTPTADGPTVNSVIRYGYHHMPTVLVFAFNDALDPSSAVDPSSYLVYDSQGRKVGISRVVYDPNNNSVAVFPDHLLNFHHPFTVTILGTGPLALTDSAGRALDGAFTGRPGSDYQKTITWRDLHYPGHAPAWTRRVGSSVTASRKASQLQK